MSHAVLRAHRQVGDFSDARGGGKLPGGNVPARALHECGGTGSVLHRQSDWSLIGTVSRGRTWRTVSG